MRPLVCAIFLVAAVLATASASPVKADPVSVTATSRADSGRLTLTWPQPIAFEALSKDGRFVLKFKRPAEADFAGPASKLKPFVGQPTMDDGGRVISFPLRSGVVALTLADGKRVVVDLFKPAATAAAEATDQTADQTLDAPEALRAASPVPAPNRVARRRPTSLHPDAVALAEAAVHETDAAAGPDDLDGAPAGKLYFDWTEPVAAAVFRRGTALWIAFDRPSTPDLSVLRNDAGDAIFDLEQRPHPDATVLRMQLASDLQPVVSRDGLAWDVTLSEAPAPASLSVSPRLRQDEDGQHSLVLPVVEPGSPLALTDPAHGDTLVLVPTVPLGAGVRRAYAYPHFRLLASAQGFAVRPLVDDLRVRAGHEGVEVTRGGGLAVTPVDDAVAARARLRASAAADNLTGLAGGSGFLPAQFTRTRQDLEAKLALAETDEERETLRLRLARHYLAHGFAAEALGATQAAERARPAIAEEAPWLILQAAASTLLGRDADAEGDLVQPVLAHSLEAAAWRTALSVMQGGSGAEAGTLADQAAVVAAYPSALREALLPRLAEAAIDAGDPSLAAKLVGLVAAEAGDAGHDAKAKYLEGRRLAANGDTAGALAAWAEVEAGVDPRRRNRVRAGEARVALALAEKRLTQSEAIEALDRLSFAWRGDRLEFAVLSRLGDLYLQQGDQPAALRTLRRAATNFPDAAQDADIPAKMSRAFAALFVGDAADRFRPIEAIALYDEFRELTPAGARGDAVIEAVAERMVALDLLGRAAALLDSQVRYRLTGGDRAKTGAGLAAIYLLDDKAEAALKALHMSEEGGLPAFLENQRRVLEARALARLGNFDEALARLEGSETAAAAAVRADIFWAREDWRRAARSIAKVLAVPKDSDAGRKLALDRRGEGEDVEAEATLHLAVALALAGEEAELARLAAARAPQMAQSRWRDVFPLITAKDMSGADLQSLARGLAPVDRFRTYLAR